MTRERIWPSRGRPDMTAKGASCSIDPVGQGRWMPGEREHPDAVAFQRTADAFRAGDMDTLAELLDEDVIWHIPGTSALAGRTPAGTPPGSRRWPGGTRRGLAWQSPGRRRCRGRRAMEDQHVRDAVVTRQPPLSIHASQQRRDGTSAATPRRRPPSVVRRSGRAERTPSTPTCTSSAPRSRWRSP
jgi:hypothetical protein